MFGSDPLNFRCHFYIIWVYPGDNGARITESDIELSLNGKAWQRVEKCSNLDCTPYGHCKCSLEINYLFENIDTLESIVWRARSLNQYGWSDSTGNCTVDTPF